MSRGREGDGERETQGKREGERRKAAGREEEREGARETGKRERGAETHICIPGPHPPPGARCRREGAPAARGMPGGGPGREADLGRGARARSQPRPERGEGPQPPGPRGAGAGAPIPLSALPPRWPGSWALQANARKRGRADTWGTFPPRLEIHRKHMLRRSRARGGGGAGIFRSGSRAAPARVPPGSRPLGRDRGAPPPGAPRGRSPGQLRRDRPGGRGERAGESGRGVERAGRPGWSPGEAAGSSLTLMVFLWNVHPRVLIDHGPKIVLKGEEATKRKKWQNTPKRVWIKSLLRGRLSCKIQGSRGSAVFLLPF